MSNPLDQPLPDENLDAKLKQAKGGVNRTTALLGVAVLLVIAFVGGVLTHKAFGTSATTTQQAAGAGRQRGEGFPGAGQGQGQQGQQGQAARRGTIGTVDHVDGTTLYVKTQDGTVVKVSTSDSTKVELTDQGALSDLKAGNQVVVQGQAGSDGTVAAQTVTRRTE
ncbi:hypothetical protein [Actinosynnema sp. NPDC020468]|uniref:hypothetical protein n=1 Tax=Actinosynnema sp. NPDC020468 TaxID=3154488 RepID=UPI0033D27352